MKSIAKIHPNFSEPLVFLDFMISVMGIIQHNKIKESTI